MAPFTPDAACLQRLMRLGGRLRSMDIRLGARSRRTACLALSGILALESGCSGITSSQVPCEHQALVATVDADFHYPGGLISMGLRDSVEQHDIGQATFDFLNEVLIQGSTASAASATFGAGELQSGGRLDLAISGGRTTGDVLPVVGVFSPPGWYRGPIVSTVFANAVRIFLRLPDSEIASVASGQIEIVSTIPFRGRITATLEFPILGTGTLNADVALRSSVSPFGCRPL
jgi:hypothetical protein